MGVIGEKIYWVGEFANMGAYYYNVQPDVLELWRNNTNTVVTEFPVIWEGLDPMHDNIPVCRIYGGDKGFIYPIEAEL